MRKYLCRLGRPFVAVTAISLFAVNSAQAQVDILAVTGAFADATTSVTAIAATMLGVVAAGIAVKWILGFLIS